MLMREVSGATNLTPAAALSCRLRSSDGPQLLGGAHTRHAFCSSVARHPPRLVSWADNVYCCFGDYTPWRPQGGSWLVLHLPSHPPTLPHPPPAPSPPQ